MTGRKVGRPKLPAAEKSRPRLPKIRDFALSPQINPLLEDAEVRIRRAHVRAQAEDLVSAATGEYRGIAAIHRVEERDDSEFVKVFAEGVKAAYSLSRPGYRVFTKVLEIYQSTSMSGGYAEAVELYWFGDGLRGEDVGMSQPTFNRGLRELIAKRFLHPRSPTTYWVNPGLFFKGDRVLFIKEYRRRKAIEKKIEMARAIEASSHDVTPPDAH